jgi:hypothetical protein
MDLSDSTPAIAPRTAAGAPLTGGIDHAALENDGPRAFGDPIGTPAPDETVLWKGRPDRSLLAVGAFHIRSFGLYMAALVIIALAMGNTNAALVAGGLGLALIALLSLLAWASARTTLYILTDARLIMRIGMAIETRINIPLKQIKAAHLRPRAGGHGDIAFELEGERLLGTLLLWPHVRPGHYAHPQPMLRAVPEAAGLAHLIAEARARHGAIERSLIGIKEAPASTPHKTVPVRVVPAPRRAEANRGEPGLEGAPA